MRARREIPAELTRLLGDRFATLNTDRQIIHALRQKIGVHEEFEFTSAGVRKAANEVAQALQELHDKHVNAIEYSDRKLFRELIAVAQSIAKAHAP